MFWYPDKPGVELTPSSLTPDLLEDGDYLAQPKMDGWRCIVEVVKGGTRPGWPSLTFTSRHGKPMDVREPFVSSITTDLCHLPVGTILDGEWMNRRPGARTKERIWLFDMLRYGELDFRHQYGAVWRYRMLRNHLGDEMAAKYVVPSCLRNYVEFMARMRNMEGTEGIVLKQIESKYAGSPHACHDNRQWIKVKWRKGESGLTPVGATNGYGNET